MTDETERPEEGQEGKTSVAPTKRANHAVLGTMTMLNKSLQQ